MFEANIISSVSIKDFIQFQRYLGNYYKLRYQMHHPPEKHIQMLTDETSKPLTKEQPRTVLCRRRTKSESEGLLTDSCIRINNNRRFIVIVLTK